VNLSNDSSVRTKSRRKPQRPARVAAKPDTAEAAAGQLLELFYPIHYKAGMALDDAMSRGRLTRTQVAILWLIRAEGEDGTTMRRKDIERRIRLWFEITSSAITKAIRAMARAPLSLVSIMEDSRSAREKRVVLTATGKRFQSAMMAEGRNYLMGIINELSAADVDQGIRFLRQAIAALEVNEPLSPKSAGRKPPAL
jgi:DNA-binding MarR family transcriptional regulator